MGAAFFYSRTRRGDNAGTLAKTNASGPGTLSIPSNHHLIAIPEKRQTSLKQAASGFQLQARTRSRSPANPMSQIAPVRGVMRDHLRKRPVEVPGLAPASTPAVQKDF